MRMLRTTVHKCVWQMNKADTLCLNRALPLSPPKNSHSFISNRFLKQRIWVCTFFHLTHVCTTHTCLAHMQAQKRVLPFPHPLGLELQMVSSCHCGSWEPNWVLCKSKQGLLTDEASLQPFSEVKFYKDRKARPPRVSLGFNQQLSCVFFNCSSAETKAVVYILHIQHHWLPYTQANYHLKSVMFKLK